MKLYCNVEINIRRSGTCVAKRKSQRSILVIGRQSIKTNELYILWQTLQNKQGTKYKIDGNIDKIFVKFVNEGKATIRLIEPPHNLIIQSDALNLKSFLHTLKLAISKRVEPNIFGVSNLNPKSMKSMPKLKMVINDKSMYPTLEGFPRTLETLHLVGLNRRSLDRQILRLRNLKILNLCGNRLTSLPKEVGCLQHLQELILSQNHLGKAALTKWTWLDQVPIKSSLKSLDISSNFLVQLPEQIGKLDSLVNLKLSENKLSCLPQNVGTLRNLKYLDVSKNNLHHMPGSMKNLSLIFMDIADNKFFLCQPFPMFGVDVASLVDCAGKIFLKTRAPYDASLIPSTLVKYLDKAKYCVCGNACFNCYIKKFVDLNLNMMSNSVKSSGNVVIPFECYFCSVACARRYEKIQYQ